MNKKYRFFFCTKTFSRNYHFHKKTIIERHLRHPTVKIKTMVLTIPDGILLSMAVIKALLIQKSNKKWYTKNNPLK